MVACAASQSPGDGTARFYCLSHGLALLLYNNNPTTFVKCNRKTCVDSNLFILTFLLVVVEYFSKNHIQPDETSSLLRWWVSLIELKRIIHSRNQKKPKKLFWVGDDEEKKAFGFAGLCWATDEYARGGSIYYGYRYTTTPKDWRRRRRRRRAVSLPFFSLPPTLSTHT